MEDGLVEVLLELDTDTSLPGVARWFGNNPGYNGDRHTSLALEHLRGRIEEIAEEATRSNKGIWTDKAIAIIQAIDPDSTFFLPGKIYRVASLEILPPTKLVLALADEQ
jgi:hypothetical protein